MKMTGLFLLFMRMNFYAAVPLSKVNVSDVFF